MINETMRQRLLAALTSPKQPGKHLERLQFLAALDQTITCSNCGSVGTIGQHCDRCGRCL